MPTNTAGSSARQLQDQQLTYISRNITFNDNNLVLTVGVLPSGAVIHRGASGVIVHTVFNAGSTNVLDIGTAATGDFFATDLALGTRAFVAIDEAVSMRVAADTTVTATVQLTGTTALTGDATVVIAYFMPG